MNRLEGIRTPTEGLEDLRAIRYTTSLIEVVGFEPTSPSLQLGILPIELYLQVLTTWIEQVPRGLQPHMLSVTPSQGKGEVGFEPTFARLKASPMTCCLHTPKGRNGIWTHDVMVKSQNWDTWTLRPTLLWWKSGSYGSRTQIFRLQTECVTIYH